MGGAPGCSVRTPSGAWAFCFCTERALAPPPLFFLYLSCVRVNFGVCVCVRMCFCVDFREDESARPVVVQKWTARAVSAVAHVLFTLPWFFRIACVLALVALSQANRGS